MEYIEDWERSLNIEERFYWATPDQRKHILSEIKYQRKQAILGVIDRARDLLDNLK